MGGREGRKRGDLEARRKRAAENSGALPYPITMADVGFLAEYLSETFFNQVFDQCLLFLVFIVFARRQSGGLVRDTLFKFRHCSLPRDSFLASRSYASS